LTGRCGHGTIRVEGRPLSSLVAAMPSIESIEIRKGIVRDGVPEGVSIGEERRLWEEQAASQELPEGVSWRAERIAGVPCVWVEDEGVQEPGVVLYFHGGGLIAGSPITHREFAARLARRARRRVLIADYRLAPEHPYPAAFEDMRAVYGALLARVPVADVAFGGESSGAGLGLALLASLAGDGMPRPSAAFFISGHFDMTLSGESMRSRAALDPFTSRQALERAAAWYTNGADPRSPRISPIFADLGALPPILLQVGDHEILLSDSLRVAERIRDGGGHVQLTVWGSMWHVWPMFVGLPEAEQALDEIGDFLAASSPRR